MRHCSRSFRSCRPGGSSCVARVATGVLLSLLAGGCSGEEPRVYGQDPAPLEPTPIFEIQAVPERFHGKTIVLEGEAFDVCQHVGCFFSIDDGTGVIYVDLQEGRQFTVPKGLGGSRVIVQGAVVAERDAPPYVIGDGVRVP